MSRSPHAPSVVIVGAGPRGAGVLERMVASAPELLSDALAGPGVDVHLDRPVPGRGGPDLAPRAVAAAGHELDGGRRHDVHRRHRSCARARWRPGPSLWDWVQELREPATRGPTSDRSSPTSWRRSRRRRSRARRLQSAYLAAGAATSVDRWAAGRDARARAPHHAPPRSTEEGRGAGRAPGRRAAAARRFRGARLRATSTPRPTPDELDLAAVPTSSACATSRPSRPPTPTCRCSRRGRRSSCAGMGLAFVDLVVLLFEGRGGRYPDDADPPGTCPAGREPRLVVGSPRGAPYHSKTHYGLTAGRPPLPRFFGPDVRRRR
jgi:hypothetical protein